MRLSHTFAAAAAVVALYAVGSPARADTAPTERADPSGTVALYGASPTNPVWQTTYAACSGQQVSVPQVVRSFDNRPSPGCQVILVEGAATFELCAGRGQIPAPFQASPVVRIEPGSSLACTVL